jgi:hypothetical protein
MNAQLHPTDSLATPNGTVVPIDRDIVPLVLRLWELGLHTKSSCQNYGESLAVSGPGMPPGAQRWASFHLDRVWLKLRPDDGERLVTLLARDPHLRFPMSQWDTPESWLCVKPVLPSPADGRPRPGSEAVHLFFPRDQLDRVLTVLSHQCQTEYQRRGRS